MRTLDDDGRSGGRETSNQDIRNCTAGVHQMVRLLISVGAGWIFKTVLEMWENARICWIKLNVAGAGHNVHGNVETKISRASLHRSFCCAC